MPGEFDESGNGTTNFELPMNYGATSYDGPADHALPWQPHASAVTGLDVSGYRLASDAPYAQYSELALLPSTEATHRQTVEPPQIAELFAAQEHIEGIAGAAAERVRLAAQEAGSDTLTGIDEHIAAYAETHGHRPGQYEGVMLMLDVLQSQPEGRHQESMRALAADTRPLLATAKALEAATMPKANLLLDHLRGTLASTTNWEAVVAKKISQGAYASLAEAAASIPDNPDTRHSLSDALAHIGSIERLQAEIAEQGDYLPEGREWQPPQDWEPNPNIIEDMHNFANGVEIALTDYVSAERYEYLEKISPASALRVLAEVCERAGITGSEGHQVAPGLAYALECQAKMLCEQFDAADRQQLDAFGSEAPTELAIHGVDVMQNKISILNPGMWVTDRLQRYPEHLRYGWRGVEFYDDPSTQPEHQGDIWTTGTLDPERIKLNLNVTTGSLADMADSVDHEQFHLMHLYRLPVLEIIRWEMVCAAEPGAMYAYPDQSPHLVNPEELSDVGEVYMNEPWNLVRDGKLLRFAFMQELLGRYDGEAVTEAMSISPPGANDKRMLGNLNRALTRAADRKASLRSTQT